MSSTAINMRVVQSLYLRFNSKASAMQREEVQSESTTSAR